MNQTDESISNTNNDNKQTLKGKGGILLSFLMITL